MHGFADGGTVKPLAMEVDAMPQMELGGREASIYGDGEPGLSPKNTFVREAGWQIHHKLLILYLPMFI